METLIGIIIAVVIAIGAYLFGSGSNRRGMDRIKSDLDRAVEEAGRAGDGVGVSKDTVERIIKNNRKSQGLVRRAREILATAKQRTKKKSDHMVDG